MNKTKKMHFRRFCGTNLQVAFEFSRFASSGSKLNDLFEVSTSTANEMMLNFPHKLGEVGKLKKKLDSEPLEFLCQRRSRLRTQSGASRF